MSYPLVQPTKVNGKAIFSDHQRGRRGYYVDPTETMFESRHCTSNTTVNLPQTVYVLDAKEDQDNFMRMTGDWKCLFFDLYELRQPRSECTFKCSSLTTLLHKVDSARAA